MLYLDGSLVMENSDQLLPEFFNFIQIIIISKELPQSIAIPSSIEGSKLRKIIRKCNMRKTMQMMQEFGQDNPSDYNIFYKMYYKNIEQCIIDEIGRRYTGVKRYVSLMRFNTNYSKSSQDMISINEYIKRMQNNQEKIYCIDEKQVCQDFIQKQKYEALYLPNPEIIKVLSEYMEFPVEML